MGFLTQIGGKALIMTANQNTKTKFKNKYKKQLETYLKCFSEAIKTKKYVKKVVFTQSIIKTWIFRNKYVKLRQAAITIQRAYREYYFNKNTAR